MQATTQCSAFGCEVPDQVHVLIMHDYAVVHVELPVFSLRSPDQAVAVQEP